MRTAQVQSGAGSRAGRQADYGIPRLARAVGWFSIGLGVPPVAAPRRVARLIGVADGNRTRATLRAVGLREIAAGLGILSRARPARWLWARVAGDAMDLTLLGIARETKRARMGATLAAVAGITLIDELLASRASRATGTSDKGTGVHVRKAVTVRRRRDEVYAFWRDLTNLPRFMTHVDCVQETDARRSHCVAKAPAGTTVEWDAEIVDDQPGERIAWRSLEGALVPNAGSVCFADAPGDRGTEVIVELDYDLPGGAVAARIAKLFGEAPELQVADDLRRFKQVLETGKVVRSEGSPQGTNAKQLWTQRPGQPLAAGAVG